MCRCWGDPHRSFAQLRRLVAAALLHELSRCEQGSARDFRRLLAVVDSQSDHLSSIADSRQLCARVSIPRRLSLAVITRLRRGGGRACCRRSEERGRTAQSRCCRLDPLPLCFVCRLRSRDAFADDCRSARRSHVAALLIRQSESVAGLTAPVGPAPTRGAPATATVLRR